MTDTTPVKRPVRALWEREPVRVVNAVFTLVAAINAVLLGAGVYDGAVAGIITGVIAALAAFVNELFTRAEVVPLKPLNDLAAAEGPPV
jgi:energy-converting hydrogenase Eha subunit A